MEKDEIISSMLMELRRGTIILCVLSQLGEATYGYNLVHTLSESGVAVDANTLYPLLRRLESQGLLTSKWETEENVKPRKYYVITSLGKEIYGIMKLQWSKTVQNMQKLMEENENG